MQGTDDPYLESGQVREIDTSNGTSSVGAENAHSCRRGTIKLSPIILLIGTSVKPASKVGRARDALKFVQRVHFLNTYRQINVPIHKYWE